MTELAEFWDSMKSDVLFYARMLGSAVLEGLFVVIWWMIQWVVGAYVMDKFPLSQLDAATAVVFQTILAVGTVVPVLIYTVVDIVRMLKRALERIAIVGGKHPGNPVAGGGVHAE